MMITTTTIALALLVSAATDDERLAKGEVIVTTEKRPGEDIPVATARAIIDAPAEKIWALVSNCAKYKETMPNILESEMVSKNENIVVCRVVADLPFPFPDLKSKTRGVHTVEPGVKYQRAWKMVEGDYKKNEGFWLVEPRGDNKSLVTYRIDAHPNVALPSWMVANISAGKLPEVMQRIRKLATGK